NYPIYNKEISAIINYSELQSAELKNCTPFIILITYYNFEYFMKIQYLWED
ncbi:hypothetical protein QR685DRAFT_438246, partial [Neurospora intermedia]